MSKAFDPKDGGDIHEELQERSHVREILSAAAKEMGFAVDSIRHEVVEKGWFGERITPHVVQEWGQGDPDEHHIAGAQDFSKDDLYGRDMDVTEQDLDQDMER